MQFIYGRTILFVFLIHGLKYVSKWNFLLNFQSRRKEGKKSKLNVNTTVLLNFSRDCVGFFALQEIFKGRSCEEKAETQKKYKYKYGKNF